jgi:hypothetical protein
LNRVGVFSESAVNGLVRRYRAGADTAFLDTQALVGVLSTQVWHHQFIESFATPTPLSLAGASVVLTETAPVLT